MSLNLEEDLLRDEGLRLKPYKDTKNILTIGVGRNLDEVGLSKDEAMYLLRNDIIKCKNQLNNYLWFSKLSPIRQNVILNMCFNLGFNGLFLFKNMITALAMGNYKLAAMEMLNSKWHKDVGLRAERLAEEMVEG